VLQAPPYEAWWPLQPGEHQVRAVARDRSGRRWETSVVAFRVWE